MNRLKKLRTEKRLTLKDLEGKVNINFTALSRVENNDRNLTDNDIEILCSFFNVSADYLLGLSDERNLIPTSSAKIALQLSDEDLKITAKLNKLPESKKAIIASLIDEMSDKED